MMLLQTQVILKTNHVSCVKFAYHNTILIIVLRYVTRSGLICTKTEIHVLSVLEM